MQRFLPLPQPRAHALLGLPSICMQGLRVLEKLCPAHLVELWPGG